jgi:hypothetical protein
MKRFLSRLAFFCTLVATTASPAAVPKGLIGSWVTAEFGNAGKIEQARMPYRVNFYTDSQHYPDDAKFDVVHVAISALAQQSCFFDVRGATLRGSNDINPAAENRDQFFCTTTMDGGGIGRDICRERGNSEDCYVRLRQDDQFLEAVFLRGNDLTWHIAGEKLIIYSPAEDATVVLELAGRQRSGDD